jgi:hypothetical protein
MVVLEFLVFELELLLVVHDNVVELEYNLNYYYMMQVKDYLFVIVLPVYKKLLFGLIHLDYKFIIHLDYKVIIHLDYKVIIHLDFKVIVQFD